MTNEHRDGYLRNILYIKNESIRFILRRLRRRRERFRNTKNQNNNKRALLFGCKKSEIKSAKTKFSSKKKKLTEWIFESQYRDLRLQQRKMIKNGVNEVLKIKEDQFFI